MKRITVILIAIILIVSCSSDLDEIHSSAGDDFEKASGVVQTTTTMGVEVEIEFEKIIETGNKNNQSIAYDESTGTVYVAYDAGGDATLIEAWNENDIWTKTKEFTVQAGHANSMFYKGGFLYISDAESNIDNVTDSRDLEAHVKYHKVDVNSEEIVHIGISPENFYGTNASPILYDRATGKTIVSHSLNFGNLTNTTSNNTVTLNYEYNLETGISTNWLLTLGDLQELIEDGVFNGIVDNFSPNQETDTLYNSYRALLLRIPFTDNPTGNVEGTSGEVFTLDSPFVQVMHYVYSHSGGGLPISDIYPILEAGFTNLADSNTEEQFTAFAPTLNNTNQGGDMYGGIAMLSKGMGYANTGIHVMDYNTLTSFEFPFRIYAGAEPEGLAFINQNTILYGVNRDGIYLITINL